MKTETHAITRPPLQSVPRTLDEGGRVGLHALDTQSVVGLVEGDLEPILSWVKDSATALASSDKQGARERLLARAIATARAKMSILEALLDERISDRDEKEAALVDRVLTSTVKRLTMLLEVHRNEGKPSRPQVVAVGHAHQVLVASEK